MLYAAIYLYKSAYLQAMYSKISSKNKQSKKVGQPNTKKLGIEVPTPDYNVGARIARKWRKSAEWYFGGRSTESLIADSEDAFGKNSEEHKRNLIELGVRQ